MEGNVTAPKRQVCKRTSLLCTCVNTSLAALRTPQSPGHSWPTAGHLHLLFCVFPWSIYRWPCEHIPLVSAGMQPQQRLHRGKCALAGDEANEFRDAFLNGFFGVLRYLGVGG